MTNQKQQTQSQQPFVAAANIKSAANVVDEATKLRERDGDLQQESSIHSEYIAFSADHTNNRNEADRTSGPSTRKPYRFIPLAMGGNGRTHMVSKESKQLIDEEVTLTDLETMTTLFYDNAFLDPTLDQFIRSHGDPHAARFAKWIHQKLSGSTIWDDDRARRSRKPVTLAEGIQFVVHDRSSAHAAAWYSPKRPESDVGRHFQLDECRVWMRLHFWALRESGLIEKSPTFADYYVRYIAHFVRVYESTAPAFARDSYRWSANPKNIQRYIDNGRRMTDVIGLTLKEARKQIPKSEAYDEVYPYHQSQRQP